MRTPSDMNVIFAVGLALSSFVSAAASKGAALDEQVRPGRAMAEGAFGTVVSVGVDRFEIERLEGGRLTVLVDEETRYYEQQKESRLEDLKPGDRVMIRRRPGGDDTFLAQIVRRGTGEEARRLPPRGERAFGEIVAISDRQLTVRNPFQGERVVVVNEHTRIQKEGQAVNLKELKVRERILALGKEINGAFVASEIRTGQFGRGGQRGGQRGREE